MSQSIRQNNLFAAEDFTNVYKSFKNVNFRAYDYESLKTTLIEYIKRQYPEDFNDYIESSEFIAIIELLCMLGTSLSFRNDINTRDNTIDNAERRESIIRLARYLSYQPKRNIATKGFLKIKSVKTTEPVKDSAGRQLNNVQIFWDDPNNDDSLEQFLVVMNAAFSSVNPFGRPYKRDTFSGVITELYQLNSSLNKEVAYPTSVNLANGSYPIDIINPDFDDDGFFEEIHPNPSNAFHFIYKNDGQGLSSVNTGFFVMFKQGKLQFKDFLFDLPVENRTVDISNKNINEDDVYVQEINQEGDVLQEWTKIPNVVGNNIIYNSIALSNKNVFCAIPGLDDTVTIKFADGNFGEIPRGIFRVWFRDSANEKLVFRPDEVNNIFIPISYVATNNQEYVLTLELELQETISNNSLSETNEDVKIRAPQVYYTQDRMVNRDDYNVFPLSQGNELLKIKAINRTYAGHSRYIDINDPTGQHQNTIVFSQDGALYKEDEPNTTEIDIDVDTNIEELVENEVEDFFANQYLKNYYYNTYIQKYEEKYSNPFDFRDVNGTGMFWVPGPDQGENDTGYFTYNTGSAYANAVDLSLSGFDFFRPGTVLILAESPTSVDKVYVTIDSIDGDGIPASASVTEIGPVQLSTTAVKYMQVLSVIPPLRVNLTTTEQEAIVEQINLENTFSVGYDLEIDEWYIIAEADTNTVDEFSLLAIDGFKDTTGSNADPSWLITFEYQPISGGDLIPSYRITCRGTKFVFESYEDVRFYYNPNDRAIDVATGKNLIDEIVLTNFNNKPRLVEEYIWDGTNWIYTPDSYSGYTASSSITYTGIESIVLKERDTTDTDITVYHLGSPVVITGEVEYGILKIGNVVTPVIGDDLQIYYNNGNEKLDNDLIWNINEVVTYEDGYVDPAKIEIVPNDINEDGIPDNPFQFETFVNENDLVYFETYTDFNGYEYTRPWKTGWYNLDTNPDLSVEGFIDGTDVTDVGLLFADNSTDTTAFETNFDALPYNAGEKLSIANALENKIIYQVDTNIFYTLVFTNLTDGGGNVIDVDVALVATTDYFTRTGRSFTLDTEDTTPDYLYYKWKHYSPRDNRIDPSITNIIDMFALTNTYYDDLIVWKKDNLDLSEFPEAPSSDSLRVQFSNLEDYKSISDQIVWRPAKFKLLFGTRADEELQAQFKIIKIPGSTITDNEIKSKVINAVDEFFSIENFDFGESFFYTELAAYIHKSLSNIVASVVIVPRKEESRFGNLFEIKCEPDELFLSTATVADVEIVRTLTETNLRIRQ